MIAASWEALGPGDWRGGPSVGVCLDCLLWGGLGDWRVRSGMTAAFRCVSGGANRCGVNSVAKGRCVWFLGEEPLLAKPRFPYVADA